MTNQPLTMTMTEWQTILPFDWDTREDYDIDSCAICAEDEVWDYAVCVACAEEMLENEHEGAWYL